MPRIIKKYANRRLYDTHASRHVTLDGIHALVAGGEDVTIIDDTDGRDITRHVLLQVICEQEQAGQPLLTTETLRRMARFYGNPVQEILAAYLERSVGAFLAEHQQLFGQVHNAQGHSPAAALQALAAKDPDAWMRMKQSFVESLEARAADPAPAMHPHEGGPGAPPRAKE